MILITRGDARTPGTFLVDIALRERLGQFGNKEFMVFSDTVNYLLTLSRLVNDFKFENKSLKSRIEIKTVLMDD